MKIISITLARSRLRTQIHCNFAPNEDSKFGFKIEVDSSVPEDEVWFVDNDNYIQKIQILDKEKE